jgi:hypothetical protein
MLCTYAPLETMDSRRCTRILRGTGSRGVQVDRRQRSSALLRSVGAGCAKNIYRLEFRRQCRSLCRESRGSSVPRGQEGGHGSSELRAIHDRIADAGTNLFWRRSRQHRIVAAAGPKGWAEHHLAPERQTTRRPGADCDSICAADPGSGNLHRSGNDYGSSHWRIRDKRPRHLLCATAIRAFAAAQTTLSFPSSQTDCPLGC